MAMSGSTHSSTSLYEFRMEIDWSAEYNVDEMKATVTLYARIRSTSQPYATRGTRLYDYDNNKGKIDSNCANYIKINGDFIYKQWYGNAGTMADPQITYVSDLASTEGTISYYTLNNVGRYVKCWGKLLDPHTFDVPIDPATGIISFRVSGHARGYLFDVDIPETTFSTSGTPADLGSKIPHKGNSSWDTDGRIWHREKINGQLEWRKRYLYRKRSNTSGDWQKI